MTNYLLAYDIAGDTVGADIFTFNETDLGGNPPFKISTSIDAGYSDISGIENWNKYGLDLDKDWLFVRDEIYEIVKTAGSGDIPTGFDTLTTPEKIVCCEYGIGDMSQRIAVVGQTAVTQLQALYRQSGITARGKRFLVASIEVQQNLPTHEEQLLSELLTNGVMQTYMQFSILGSLENSPFQNQSHLIDGIADWLYGRTGTAYDGIGLLQKGWTPDIETDMQALVDRLYDILINGNYIL